MQAGWLGSWNASYQMIFMEISLLYLKKYYLRNVATALKFIACTSHMYNSSAKEKEHKKYEFGSKVSNTVTKKSGVIIGELNIAKNDCDAHTLEPVLDQQQR